MRTRIEVYKIPSNDIFVWTVDMAIGAYGRFDQVASGEAKNLKMATYEAQKEAQAFMNRRALNQNPVLRQYIEINADPISGVI